jgi:TolA-binding protein
MRRRVTFGILLFMGGTVVGLALIRHAFGQDYRSSTAAQVSVDSDSRSFDSTAQEVEPAASGQFDSSRPAEKSRNEVDQLLKQYAAAKDEKGRGDAKKRLAEVLGRQFDLQQAQEEKELTRLEEQLKRLRDLMKKRQAARQTIIDHRLDQLVRETQGLGWLPPSARLRRNDSLGINRPDLVPRVAEEPSSFKVDGQENTPRAPDK